MAGGLRLDPVEIIETVEVLQRRIQERFPDANLTRFCGELLLVAQKASVRTAWIRQPLVSVRIGAALVLAALVGLIVALVVGVAPDAGSTPDVNDFLQSTEAVLSSTVILGATAVFLLTFEQRIKRFRAIRAIHELRDMAHIVDMHQLTKDPAPYAEPRMDTLSSPPRGMSAYALTRYLDYCSEMLALISKVGALYVGGTRDPVVLDAVDGLQGLVDGLSQKIWHKIALVSEGARLQESLSRA